MNKTIPALLITGVLSVLASSAVADEITVYDAANFQTLPLKEISHHFAVNPELGRAWVTLSLNPQAAEVDAIVQEQRILVPGLRFDAAQNAVVMQANGKLITCARVEKSLFGEPVVRANGQCSFKITPYQAQQDNGYELVMVDKIKVAMKF